MTGLPDTHCHLDLIEETSPEETLAQARDSGVDFVCDIGLGVEGARNAIARADALGTWVSIGYHPNELETFRASPDKAMQTLRELASHPRVVAIGETGLDNYWDKETPEVQRDAFAAHIALARELDKTMVIHSRDANEQVMEVLSSELLPSRIIMHCFSGDVAYATACCDRGIYCSFAGNVTFPRNEGVRDAARSIPDELVLVETDSPYLSPHPHRGKPNAPYRIPVIAGVLASTRSADPTDFAATLAANARRAFAVA